MPAAIWPISSKIVNCCGAEGGTKDLVCARETENITRLIKIKYNILQLHIALFSFWLNFVTATFSLPAPLGPSYSGLEIGLVRIRPSGVAAVVPLEGFPLALPAPVRTIDLV